MPLLLNDILMDGRRISPLRRRAKGTKSGDAAGRPLPSFAPHPYHRLISIVSSENGTGYEANHPFWLMGMKRDAAALRQWHERTPEWKWRTQMSQQHWSIVCVHRIFPPQFRGLPAGILPVYGEYSNLANYTKPLSASQQQRTSVQK